ncbi:MAG TPA: glycosyltransferase family 39 protein [Thermoanaerobaculia bacterium]|nr:glycosyltransferase family 39 protein [Thermoanaerobaculia bacterium]
MPSAAFPAARPRRSGVWRWALGVAAFLCATAAWTVPVSADGLEVLRTSFTLHLTGSFRLPPPPPGSWLDPYQHRKLPGGVPGYDVSYPPLAALVRAALFPPISLVPAGALRGRVADAVMQLLPVLLTALAVVPLTRLARLAGCSRRAAPALASALLVTTFLGPLGRLDFPEPFIVLLSSWSLERILVARRREGAHRLKALAAGGGLVGLALLAKPTAFVLVPAMLLAVARPLRRPLRARDFAAFGAGMLPGLTAFFALNNLRYGSPLDFGYRWGDLPPGGERLPLAWTALRLTVLPNRGVFWFAPLLLLAFFVPMRNRLAEPLRTDCAAALVASGGFFAANLWWWVWEGGFGWGPRLLAPAVALSIPWLVGRGPTWRRAGLTLAFFGFALNLPAYLLYEVRIYDFSKLGNSPGAPVGPVMRRHRNPAAPGEVDPLQRVHYVPAAATWIEGPRILFALATRGNGKETGDVAGDARRDPLVLRLLLGKPALPAVPGVGLLLFDDAEMAADVDPRRALAFAQAAIDFGGPPVDTRAFVSMLLLRSGRASEAARVCREALALDPGRADLRSNLALAERMMKRAAGPRPPG